MTSAAFQDPGGRAGPPSALFMPDMSAGAKAEDVHPYKDSNSNHRQEARLPRPGMPLSQGASTVQGITDQGRLLMMLNQRENQCPARTGSLRAWAYGKTTAIKLLGKTHELKVRMKYHCQGRIPVV